MSLIGPANGSPAPKSNKGAQYTCYCVLHKLSATYRTLLDKNHHLAIHPFDACLLHGFSAICCISTRTRDSITKADPDPNLVSNSACLMTSSARIRLRMNSASLATLTMWSFMAWDRSRPSLIWNGGKQVKLNSPVVNVIKNFCRNFRQFRFWIKIVV